MPYRGTQQFRSWVMLIALALPTVGFSQTDEAATPPTPEQQRRTFEKQAGEQITPETQRAINRGLAFLAARQSDDGSFGSGSVYRQNVAVAALSGLAFLAAGNSPGRGPYGEQVTKTTEFLLSRALPSGYIIDETSAGHGPMYGHGFATLYLAEVHGMTPGNEVRTKLQAAVKLIVDSQNPEGGWRYDPDGREADISVTVCQIMALRAARNAGIAVPKATIDACINYVRNCQNSDGGFRYQLQGRPVSAFPRSAAGIVSLYSAGVYEGDDIDRGLDYLRRFHPRGELLRFEPHFFYGQYYAAQAMWQMGGDDWNNWFPSLRDDLIANQIPDGSWPDSMVNAEYATAMGCIVLQTPNNLVPIFQR